MTILNWLYWKKQQLIKKTANNAETDLVVLGAEVPFTTRDDGYQDYAMTLKDAVFSGETAANTITTGVYDTYPYVVTPTLTKSTTKIVDETSGVTYVGYKLQGQIQLNAATSYLEYLGTTTVKDGLTLLNTGLIWKSTGSVQFSQGSTTIIQPLSYINLAKDTGATTTTVQIYFATVPSVIGNDILVDIFIDVSPISVLPPPVGDVELIVSFQLELTALEQLELTFNV